MHDALARFTRFLSHSLSLSLSLTRTHTLFLPPQLGAFQLEREIRSIINYVSSCTSCPIRDKFVKMKQITLLLNLESVAEAAEHFGSSASASLVAGNRLSPSEVRSFLKLRVDFSREEIRRIKL